jgi:hypothetical protein
MRALPAREIVRNHARRTATIAAIGLSLGAAVTIPDASIAAATPNVEPAAKAGAAAALRVSLPAVQALPPGTPAQYEAGWGPGVIDYSALGYTEKEYTLTGTATSFTSATPLTADGRWTVTPATTAKYKTRIIVRTPKDPSKFNGIIVAEWLNSANAPDWDPDWAAMHDEIIRDGYGWVGVTTQSGPITNLIDTYASRYGSLIAPGDSYSYDIYSQAAAVLRHGGRNGRSLTSGLKVKHIIAAGVGAQGNLRTYLDGVQPIAKEFDGFLVNDGGAGPALSQAPQPVVNTPPAFVIRPDTGAKTMFVISERFAVSDYADIQDDSATFRLWETAGTAHVDQYQSGPFQPHTPLTCGPGGLQGVNNGDMHYVLDAALSALTDWVTNNQPPARAPRVQLNTTTTPVSFVRDSNGNAIGGVPTPSMQVPTATLLGTGAGDCNTWGSRTPFSSEKLKSLYPTFTEYRKKAINAVQSDVDRGFLLPSDGLLIENATMDSTVGTD